MYTMQCPQHLLRSQVIQELRCQVAARVSLASLLCGSMVMALLMPQAMAQGAYPDRPIRWIVPFAPGGGADNLARTLQSAFAEAIGQQIIIDNRGGGGSVIGTALAAKAPPDGYTQLIITTTFTVNTSFVPKLPYDSVADFAPVSQVAAQPNILVVHPSLPVKTMKELVALAKGRPGALSFASGGNGSSPHLTGELFKLLTGTQIIHVPYKSAGPALTDLIGGHVQLMFVGPLSVEGFIKAGRVRAVAVANARRLSSMPNVPTTSEAGTAGLESGTWYGILAPAKTPQPIIERIHAAALKTLQQPDVKTRLHAQGVDIIGDTPQQFAAHMKSETAKWARVIREAKLKPD